MSGREGVPVGGRLASLNMEGVLSLLAQVYSRCMARTNIDLDEDACRSVMERYRLPSKRQAVNFALRTVAAEPLALDEARRLRGSGWDGDLNEMRAGGAG